MAVTRRRLALGWIVVSLCATVAAAAADEGVHGERRQKGDVAQRTIAGTTVVGDIDRQTLQSALEVLPRRPERIVMVTDDAAPSARHRMRDLDAFVPIGSRVVYLRRRSATLRAAEYEGGAWVLVLAAVIWHECGGAGREWSPPA